MSKLLDEIIAGRKAKAIEYEEYLKRIAELAARVQAGYAEDIPDQLKKSPGLRALYSNLKAGGKLPAGAGGEDPVLDVPLRIDEAVIHIRPADWRGAPLKELVIKAALYEVLQDEGEVERLFPI